MSRLYLTPASARQIADDGNLSRHNFRRRPRKTYTPDMPYMAVLARTTASGVPAAAFDGTTLIPGVAVVDIFDFDEDAGGFQDNGFDYPVINFSESPVAPLAFITLHNMFRNLFVVTAESCPPLELYCTSTPMSVDVGGTTGPGGQCRCYDGTFNLGLSGVADNWATDAGGCGEPMLAALTKDPDGTFYLRVQQQNAGLLAFSWQANLGSTEPDCTAWTAGSPLVCTWVEDGPGAGQCGGAPSIDVWF